MLITMPSRRDAEDAGKHPADDRDGERAILLFVFEKAVKPLAPGGERHVLVCQLVAGQRLADRAQRAADGAEHFGPEACAGLHNVMQRVVKVGHAGVGRSALLPPGFVIGLIRFVRVVVGHGGPPRFLRLPKS